MSIYDIYIYIYIYRTPSATQEENIQPVAKRRKLKKITKAEEIEVKVPQHIAQPISQNVYII